MQRTVLLLIATLLLMVILPGGCATTNPRRAAMAEEITAFKVRVVLDQWHFAAAHGLFDLYFDLMTDDAVFLGTDASERWTRDEFMDYARPHFADGKGWAYTPSDRHIVLSDDANTAWVDELMHNEKYGTLRGTAVLVHNGDDWKIAHYSLTFLVPNEKAGAVVDLISK